MNNTVLIVDYGMGNIRSIQRRLRQAGAICTVSPKPEDILRAEKLILPGVGHFKRAMQNLQSFGMLDALNEAVLQRKTPVLGICLGMQLMARHSEEGDANGLSWFDGTVVRFRIKDHLRYKVPHMGWNQIVQKKESTLLNGVPENSEFYFVHSFHFQANDAADVLAETNYSYPFVSAIEKENIFGVQFHPEKSHEAGIILLKNFIGIKRDV